MKKKILLIIICILLLCSCKNRESNPAPQEGTTSEISTIPEVSTPENSHTISFTYDNTKEGYSWDYVMPFDKDSSLKFTSKEIIFDKTVFTFNSIAEGEAGILMMYENDTDAAYQIEYQIKVDENMNIVVVDSIGSIDGVKPAKPEIN